MSYEYKELIEQAIIDDDRPLDWEEGFKELDEVYAQAAKADEYEAKAKAWDKLMFEIDEINDEVAGKEFPSKIIMVAKITALSNVMKEYKSGKSE